MSAGAKECTDYAEELGWEFTPGYYFKQCCDSCHDDYDGGWDDMSEIYDDARTFEGRVCCRVAEAVREGRK